MRRVCVVPHQRGVQSRRRQARVPRPGKREGGDGREVLRTEVLPPHGESWPIES